MNFSHQSPLEVLNKLFQSFYTDTTMFSRSKTALKLALEKHNVTYETAADWYGLIGWDMPVVTDENNILVSQAQETLNKFHKQIGVLESQFFNDLCQLLKQSSQIFNATKPINLKNRRTLKKIIGEFIEKFEDLLPQNRTFFKKFGTCQDKLVIQYIKKSIKLLKNMEADPYLTREDAVLFTLKLEKAFDLFVVEKLDPEKQKIAKKDIETVKNTFDLLLKKKLKISKNEVQLFNKIHYSSSDLDEFNPFQRAKNMKDGLNKIKQLEES